MIEKGHIVQPGYIPDVPPHWLGREVTRRDGYPMVIGSAPWLIGGCPWLTTGGVAILLMGADLLHLWPGFIRGAKGGGADYSRACDTSKPLFDIPVGEDKAIVLAEGLPAPTTWLPTRRGSSPEGIIVRWVDGPEEGLMLDWLEGDEEQLTLFLAHTREMAQANRILWTPTDVEIAIGVSPLVMFDSLRAGERVGQATAGLVLPLPPGSYSVETALMHHWQPTPILSRLLLHRFVSRPDSRL